MDDYESLPSSISKEEVQLLSAQPKVEITQNSKQIQYYYRRTKDKQRGKYTPFREQENLRRQLKRYHATRADSSGVSMDPAASKTSSDHCDNCEFGTDTCNEGSLIMYQKMMRRVPSMALFLLMKARNHLH